MLGRWFDLIGKVAIVTGGGRGIRKNIALDLAEHGADVVVCSRTKKDLDQIVKEIGTQGIGLGPRFMPPSQFDGLVVEVKRAFGHIDVIANDVGDVLFEIVLVGMPGMDSVINQLEKT
jgi:gluconate 5-dehydrogenase